MDFNKPEILNVYLYGSRIYGTDNEKSDYDYVVVIKDDYYDVEQIKSNNNDYNFYTKTQWDAMCKNNDVVFCECYFLQNKIKETYKPAFKLDPEKIRSNFSKMASNSYVKCKKKLIVEKDYNPYIAKKSLWHSFRILMYGIQMLKYNKIIDYQCANFLYNDIVNNKETKWDYFKNKYQPLYNQYKSEFRKFDQSLDDIIKENSCHIVSNDYSQHDIIK